MLELYHNSMSTCSAKARIALGAKRLEWKSHEINLRKAESQRPDYLKLNPDGVVPTLIHNGEVIRESSVIIEYLDEAFPDPPLKPADALGRARMRSWIVQVDESIHPVTGTLTWALSTASVMRAMHTQKELDAYVEGLQVADKRVRRREILELGVRAPTVSEALKRMDRLVAHMETQLENTAWLVGDRFTLADIALAPYLTRMDMLGLGPILWGDRPRYADWYRRLQEQPGYRAGLTQWINEERRRQLHEGGAREHDAVRRLLRG
ncbi:MAG TPA: glutathione S-transferase family protein [Stellaceae bacterium]|nr:glutathione S-transferase family protein [Stellaceae bacterium]